METKKRVLFGTERFYQRFITYRGENEKPSYIVDNDPKKWGKEILGYKVYPLSALEEEKNDIEVIICEREYETYLNALLEIGDFKYKIYPKVEENHCCQEIDKDLDSVLQRVQNINYEMLAKFDSVCRKYDVEYFLNYGSVLGAVRHKGMIPWDNDIDTVLKRSEWDKLREHKNDFDGLYYWLGNDLIGNKKYYDCIDRIAYKNAYVDVDNEMREYYENRYNSIHLDMFLIDKTYDNFKGKFQRYELAFLYGLMGAYRHKAMFNDYNKKMKFANFFLCIAGKMFSLNWLKKRADKVARRFEGDENAPYYFISNDVFEKLKMLFPSEIFEHAVDAEFGDVKAKIACESKKMCNIIFGDYLRLPAIPMRKPHIGRKYMSIDSYIFK